MQEIATLLGKIIIKKKGQIRNQMVERSYYLSIKIFRYFFIQNGGCGFCPPSLTLKVHGVFSGQFEQKECSQWAVSVSVWAPDYCFNTGLKNDEPIL